MNNRFKTLFFVIFIAVLFVTAVVEVSKAVLYHGYLSDSKYECVKEKLQGYEFMYSQPDDQEEIVNHIGYNPYILRTQTVFTSYAIEDIGLVPRWSRTAKLLDQYYDSLIKNDTRVRALARKNDFQTGVNK